MGRVQMFAVLIPIGHPRTIISFFEGLFDLEIGAWQ